MFSEDIYNKNVILQGDCLQLSRDLNDASFDLVLTDPPFFVMKNPDIKFKNRANFIQNVDFDNSFHNYKVYIDFIEFWVEEMYRVMKKDSSFYSFFGKQYVTDLVRACESVGMEYGDIITWHKTNPAVKVRKNSWVSSTESIVYMKKGKPKFNFTNQNDMHDFLGYPEDDGLILEYPVCAGNERLKDERHKTSRGTYPAIHATQKPLKLVQFLVELSTDEGDNVIDPFSGTGTTNHACFLSKRHCLGMELNSLYYEASLERMRKLNRVGML